MSNYTSSFKAQINKHIRDTYKFDDYSGIDPKQLKSKILENIEPIINQTCPLPRETFLWLRSYVRYVRDIGRWLIFDNAKGIWELKDDDLAFGHLIDDVIQAIYDNACLYKDEGLKFYALTMINSPSKRSSLKNSLKGSTLLTVNSIRELNNYRYRLFTDISGAMILIDMEKNTLQDAMKEVSPKDIKDLMIQSKANTINVKSYNEPKLWLSIIRDVMTADNDTQQEIDEKVEYFKKSLAYMMSPNNYAQAFIWWLGDKGGNGKSTISQVLSEVLGEAYTVKLQSRLLLKNKEVGYKRDDDLAMMNGKSLYVFNEFEEKAIIHTTTLKNLTEGMGEIVVRPAYGKNHPVEVIGTPLAICNDLPMIEQGQNIAPLFRRFVLIRFDHVFTNPDTSIMSKLRKEYADIHTWLYLNYFQYRGINIVKEVAPSAFANTLIEYKKDSNTFKEFMDICIERRSGSKMTRKQLYDAYTNYMTGYRNESVLPLHSKVIRNAINEAMVTFRYTMPGNVQTWEDVGTSEFYSKEVMRGIEGRK